ncbi:unnamed protein product [Heligmosomoides polygyrus]|uniref:Uncharacterized protein n=1 Tax=Heligmosomoides polygyrus TaxID=6339 RepID=A0A183FLN9_HELPZ|nr:unnamed protein product [Heligmosomoides polygyrus]
MERGSIGSRPTDGLTLTDDEDGLGRHGEDDTPKEARKSPRNRVANEFDALPPLRHPQHRVITSLARDSAACGAERRCPPGRSSSSSSCGTFARRVVRLINAAVI